MRVLLTGNLGYVGTVAGPFLRERGHQVVGLDLGFFEEAFLEPPPVLETLRRDVRDVAPADLEGFEAIVHLAGLSNDPLGELNPELTDAVNRQGTLHLARAAREAGVARFVFASSCSLYGKGEALSLDEMATFNPQTAYARSKVEAEMEVAGLAGPGFSPTFLRFATAYGYSPRLRFDLVVNSLVGWALTEGVIRILSDGSPWRPLIHVRDMALAIASVLDAPREAVHAQAFNAGSSLANYQVKDIAQAVQRHLPEARVSLNPDASPDTRSYRVDFSKIGRVLPAFQVAWDLDRGILDLVENLKRVGIDTATFQHRHFTRLKQLQHLLEEGSLGPDLRWTRQPNA
jgi:nucleoside-diphosphate-sugar epimerase